MVAYPKRRLSTKLLKVSLTITGVTVLFFGVAIFAVEFQAALKEEQHQLQTNLTEMQMSFTKQIQRFHGRVHLLTENPTALRAAVQSLKSSNNPEVFFGAGVLFYEILHQKKIESGGQSSRNFVSLLDSPRRQVLKVVELADTDLSAGILTEAHAIDGGDVLSIRVVWNLTAVLPWKEWITPGFFQAIALADEKGKIIWSSGPWPELAAPAAGGAGSIRELTQDGKVFIETAEELSAFSEPLTLRAITPKRALYAKAWRMSQTVLGRMLTIVIIGMGFVLILALWVRHVMKPLEEISTGVQHIADGNLETVLKAGGDDEIAFLADTLNEMTHRLKVKEQSVQAHIQLLKEKNMELQDLSERLKEADRLKDHFLAVLSHELRTPLTAILGYAELSLEGIYGPLTPKQVEILTFIQGNGNKLLSIMEDLLDIAKIRAGTIEVNADEFSPKDLLSDIRKFAENAIRSKPDVHYVEDFQNGLPVMKTDHVKLEQILTNLLSNAIKFTEHGTVKFSASSADGMIRFQVEDTGIGIAPQHLPKIFDAFVQLDSGTRRRYGGTGLGLTICKSLVELLGGRIGVESELGKGSRFTVTLPAEYRPPAAPAGPGREGGPGE